jgi:hypothetical protein
VAGLRAVHRRHERLLEQRRERPALHRELPAAGLDAVQTEQVFEQIPQPARVALDRGHEVHEVGRQAVGVEQDRLDVAHDGRHGCAQLVGHVRHEIGASPVPLRAVRSRLDAHDDVTPDDGLGAPDQIPARRDELDLDGLARRHDLLDHLVDLHGEHDLDRTAADRIAAQRAGSAAGWGSWTRCARPRR